MDIKYTLIHTYAYAFTNRVVERLESFYEGVIRVTEFNCLN